MTYQRYIHSSSFIKKDTCRQCFVFFFWLRFLNPPCHQQDIRYQRRYRQRRKAELVKLQQTLTALNSKTTFYQDQMNYYDTYIKTCLDNLNRKWVLDTCHSVDFASSYFWWFRRHHVCVLCVFRNSRRSIKVDSKGDDKGSKKWKPQSLKYTAARLHEKGVILEIEGLQVNQWVQQFNTKHSEICLSFMWGRAAEVFSTIIINIKPTSDYNNSELLLEVLQKCWRCVCVQ